ncbi:MAG: FAD-dependent oxidoreductase [Bradyrhizobium sp.]|nr:FAD-dependent oxidoreductase [Bradyrhizobium sp.]
MANPGARDHQMFPTLSQSQIETAKRFASAPPRRFKDGELVFDIGDLSAPAWLVLEGSLEVFRQNGLLGEVAVTAHHVGQMSGEVSQLSGRPSLAGARAGWAGCTAVAFDAPHLRALIIGSADLGEIIMRAFILRRVELINSGGAGSVLIGIPGAPALSRLQVFLTRSGYPHMTLDATSDAEGLNLIERLGILPTDLPLMVCPNGTVLKRPSDQEAALCLGVTPKLDPNEVYDVAIVGAGPAGLAAAVYAASEGLRVILLDERSAGGQAGASSRIENYLGFPTGISGQALAGRAFNQALKFGVEIALPLEVSGLEQFGSEGAKDLGLTLSGGQRLRARTIVVASGARYRRPGIPGIEAFEGAGVSYWASPIEAKLCAGEEIALVGGGNSAGQAIAFLAPQVRRLHLIVRRRLEETMSQYLVDRIAALPNVELYLDSEIAGLDSDAQAVLSSAVIRNRTTRVETRQALRHVFLFIGADPNAGWIGSQVTTDDKGFIVTGEPFRGRALAMKRQALPLETTVPNIFAIGDVRAGSTKRVAAAVGEGAAVVAQIHLALREMSDRR